MLKIDAHQHFWKFDEREYGWITEGMRVLRRDFLPADLQREMAAVGVSGSIAVQARQTVEETNWLLELAGQNEFIKGVVGWVPLITPSVGGVIEQLAESPKLRGLRHVLQDEPDENYILREDFNRGIRELARFDLTYDILIFERHLPQTIKFVDKHPQQRFVVDHLAKPRVRDGVISPWRENIRELAKRENVWCKISGLATEADHSKWTEGQLMPYMETVLEAFGPKRVMFGSDWPVCSLAVGYGRWAELVDKLTVKLPLNEQLEIWGDSAVRAYRVVI
jgi:L-fuconolactonase